MIISKIQILKKTSALYKEHDGGWGVCVSVCVCVCVGGGGGGYWLRYMYKNQTNKAKINHIQCNDNVTDNWEAAVSVFFILFLLIGLCDLSAPDFPFNSLTSCHLWDSQCQAPVVMNGVEAHISVATDVGVKNLGDEANLGGTHGIAARRTHSL